MIILIDGYNLLKSLYSTIVQDQERDEYINLLKRYAKKKKHTIILVFDGGFSDWQSTEKHGDVLVVFSGVRETADDVIKRYLEDMWQKDILLVTADRELVDHGKSLSVFALAPMAFDGYVKQALKKLPTDTSMAGSEAIKFSGDEEHDSELDDLMREASLVVMHKPDEEFIKRRGPKNSAGKLSKKDRKLQAKLKKI